ncbi:hypothetical protein CW748_08570, partial [Alteromonadales bacterium alter-6D02]
MSAFAVVLKQSNGVQKTYPLTVFQSLSVMNGTTYTLIDVNTKQVPDDLVLRRKDNDLILEVDGEVVAQIENFYIPTVEATFSVDGTVSPANGMAIENNHDTEFDVISSGDSAVVWPAGDNDILADVGGVATLLALGGAALAISDKHADSHSPKNDHYEVTLAPAAGPFESIAMVELYDKDGNLLERKNHDFSTGPVTFTITNGYVGPILAKLIDANGDEGDYVDEASGQLVSLGDSLRAMSMADGNSDVTISITPLTELAARQAGIDSSNSVDEAQVEVNNSIGELFGVDDILAPATTVVEEEYDATDGINASEQYGNVLALLSGTDAVTGSIDSTLEKLDEAIVAEDDGSLAISQSGVELLQEGVEQFEQGANSALASLADALIEPPVIIGAENGFTKLERDQASDNGITIQVAQVSIGDTVTIQWGDQTFTAEVTADDLVDDVALILMPIELVDAAGDGDIKVTSQVNDQKESPANIIIVDTAAPTVEIVLADTSLTAGETSMVTFTFSEAPIDFTLDDVNAVNGQISELVATADPLIFTATYAPNIAIDSTENIITVTANYTDGLGNVGAAASSDEFSIDTLNEAPSFELEKDSGSLADDNLTNNVVVNVSLASDVASWEYSVNGGDTWVAGTGTSFELAADTTYAADSVQVRQTDNAGNVSAATTNTAQIETDNSVAAPTFTLVQDTGSSTTDSLTNNVTVNVALVTDVASWEYSVDGGTTWLVGSGTSFELATDTTYAADSVQVRQTDNAGNVSAATTNTAQIETDNSVAAPTFTLAQDTGSSTTDSLTNNVTVNVALVADVASWEYSVDGGTNWLVGSGTSFDLANDSIYSVGAIKVRQTDNAGNLSTIATNTAQIETDNSLAAPTFTLAQDTGASTMDSLTNNVTVNVALVADVASWEYSVDGGDTWMAGTGTSFDLAADTTYAADSVQVRQTDNAGNVSAATTNTAQIETDNSVAAPTFALAQDTGSSTTDSLTNHVTVNVALVADVASWEYSVDGGDTWVAGTGTSFELAADTTYAADSVQVRQTDTAGNVSAATTNTAQIETDNSIAAPTFTLAQDTGSSTTDSLTNNVTVNVALVADVANWEYSVDGGDTWMAGTGTSFELAADTTYAADSVQVRQTDNAGNVSAATANTAQIETDNSVAAPTFTLAQDTGSSTTDSLTNNVTVNVALVADVASWEYSVDGGTTWLVGSGTSFELATDTTYAADSVQVRQTDNAGNVSAATTNTAQIETDNSVAAPTFTLAQDTGSSTTDSLTNNVTVNVALVADVASWEYSVDGGETWMTGTGTSFELAADITYAADSVQVRQTDNAGNSSAVTTNNAAIETDLTIVTPTFAFKQDSGSSTTDAISNTTTIDVALVGDVASWKYSLDGGTNWLVGEGTSLELAANTLYSIGAVRVIQIDHAGNESAEGFNQQIILTDMTVAPAELALVTDTGASDSDHITNDARVSVNLATDVASWQFSLDGGNSWNEGAGTSFGIANNTVYASDMIQVRQTDIAGNQSTATIAVTTDSTVEQPSFTINTDTGSSTTDGLTSDATVNVVLADDVASWQYSLDGGMTWLVGVGTSFELANDTAYAAGAIRVRQTDVAGNLSGFATNDAAVTTDMTNDAVSFELATDSGQFNNDQLSNNNVINVTLAADVASWEYSVDGGTTWLVGSGSSFELTQNTTFAADSVQVRQTDHAGNVSAVSANSQEIITDTILPTVSINDDTAATATGDITYTFTFSEAMDNFSADDVTLTGGTKGTFTQISATEFTLVVTPDTNSVADIVVSIGAGIVADIAGNTNLDAVDSTQLVDTVIPTVSITDNEPATATDDVVYTFTFSEDMTGFTVDDIVLTGGSKGIFTEVSATEYTLVVTPNSDSTTDLTVNVAADVAIDAAGNNNTVAVESTQAVDTVIPSVAISDDTTGTATGDVLYTFTFSEDMTGFTVDDIVLTGGSKGIFTEVSATEYTLVVTPNSDSTTDLTVNVAADVAIDAAGNNNTVAVESK